MQAIAWFQKAADLGDAAAKSALGSFFLTGDARAGVAMNEAQGFALVRQAFAEAFSPALVPIACCYLMGQGVDKDAAHAVSLLRQVVNQEDITKAEAEKTLAFCYMMGDGVEADTAQAALWCQRAADGGEAFAIKLLPLIRTCSFCHTMPARKHCERCRKVRYCNAACYAAHWNCETDPHMATAAAQRRRLIRRQTARPPRRSRNRVVLATHATLIRLKTHCGAERQVGHWNRDTNVLKRHCRRHTVEASEEGTATGAPRASQLHMGSLMKESESGSS